MKSELPASLVQIHYHYRTGGVARVMERYAESFARLYHTRPCHNIIMGDIRNGVVPARPSYTLYPVDACRYHTFRSKKSFAETTGRCIRSMKEIIDSLPRPVALIGHNLSLGKNIALSAAFARLALEYQAEGQVNFYSVVHDMAEEGRVDCLRMIRQAEDAGIPVWKYLYPRRHVRYIVLNKRNYELFAKAGFSPQLLFNPIDPPQRTGAVSSAVRKMITTGLSRLAKIDGTAFDVHARTFFYPVRVISRKNILEALLLVCYCHSANLVLGGPGTSRQDQRLFDAIKQCARKHRLPVVFDAERLREYLPRSCLWKNSVFPLLFRAVDCCVSTSIAEGFGYALYEPWLYDKDVVGRLPQGVGRNELINLDHLYARFDIPSSWIPLDRLSYHYCVRLTQCTQDVRDKGACSAMVKKKMVRKGMVDFGSLSQHMQFELLDKICSRMLALPGDYTGAAVRLKKVQRDANARIVMRTVVGDAFDTSFHRCITTPSSHKPQGNGGGAMFLDYFLSLDRFRLLMAPHIF